MSRRSSFRIFYLVLALTLFAASSQALPSIRHGNREAPRASQVEGERGGFFTFLLRLFGKSGGGMDPNGGYAGPGLGPQ